MQTFATPLALAERLISIPSYVDTTNHEIKILDFLSDYLSTAFPSMLLEKQKVSRSGRYNLLLRGKIPRLFVLGHIDTVQPKDGWTSDPFTPAVKQSKLYGLGAADMKSSLAAFLWALGQEKQTVSLDNLALLIYVDEEYDFKGIRRFIEDQVAIDLSPAMTLSLDGELAVGSGCRGVIELSFMATGKSGHAANPANGINAITESMAAITELAQTLTGFTDATLGATTTNVAAIQGGVRREEPSGTIRWLEEGNVIPDGARIVLEVRPSVSTVNAAYITRLLEAQLERRGLGLSEVAIRHDIAPWPVAYDETSLNLLRKIYHEAGVPFRTSNRQLQGYIDAQMVADKIKVPTFIIGTGGSNKHGANENVPLQDIEDAAWIYRQLLREVLS